MAQNDSLAMFRGGLLAECEGRLASLELMLADRDADVRRWKALAEERCLGQVSAADAPPDSQDTSSDVKMGDSLLFTSEARDDEDDGSAQKRQFDASSSREGVQVQVLVKMLSGKTLVLRIKLSSAVSHLKSNISSHTGISTHCFYLSASGRHLDEGRLTSDYGISRDSTITMVARCPFRTAPAQAS